MAADDYADSTVNLSKVASDKAVDVIKQLSGKDYDNGKKVIENVIVFTNASGGTGASTIIGNVAFAATQRGLNALIIDLNILCPVQHTYLGIDQTLEKPDLVSFLNGQDDLRKCIDSTQEINILFANNRTLSDELNCNNKVPVDNFISMLQTVRNYYDLVLIDCPMRIDSLLYNTAFYCCDAIYMVWDEGIGSIINTEKVRRNMAISGIDSYTKMRVILNKRTSIDFSDFSLKKLNLELIDELPFSTDIIDNGLRGRIFCDKGSATNKNGTEFARKIDSITDKILKIGGYIGSN